MKLITLALGCMGIVTAVNIDDEFVKFVKDFKKPYVEGSSEWLKVIESLARTPTLFLELF